MKNYCVVTTVNSPSKAIEELYKKFGEKLIIVGDKKTPANWEYNGITPNFQSAIYAPDNHYARKNLGYLEAIRNKAEVIFSTDDDIIPNENWKVRKRDCLVDIMKKNGWLNVYSVFLYGNIWQRGTPLNKIHDYGYANVSTEIKSSSIQQGLSDIEPDVDAIYRLVVNERRKFGIKKSVYLSPNTWSPINSQSTWWFPRAYPLMYLPIYCTFRCTDIWRGFIAQKCLWALGEGVMFHSPSETIQDRNEHDLMSDFEQEIDGYRYNERIAISLSELKLKEGDEFVCDNLLSCYLKLVDDRIIVSEEIDSVKQWIKDYEFASYLADTTEKD